MATCLTPEQFASLDAGFTAAFDCHATRYFSAPGRTEIGGNHTDHQHGLVLAAAVNLDTRAAVRPNGTNTIRVHSAGYAPCVVQLDALTPCPEERNTTTALIRGVAAQLTELGHTIGGFDAYVESSVLPGSGLSSSAAFEVLIATIFNHLFLDGKLPPPQLAMIGQYAETVFFGKPCGLMDQMASAVGGLITIDFADPAAPVVQEVDFDFDSCGYALCIIDTGADHADLTEEYAAIPVEMKSISAHFGKAVLRDLEEDVLYGHLPHLRQHFSDRAILRAMHFYNDNQRVTQQVQALQNGDFHRFLQLVTESGQSSYMYLQNVLIPGTTNQAVAVTLALCQALLNGQGAYRVHGGGFAGTVQAFVPKSMLEEFRSQIDRYLKDGACHVLSIRKEGCTELFPK